MNNPLWLAFAASVIGLFLIYAYAGLIAQAGKTGGKSRGALAYWPAGLILLLVASSWVPVLRTVGRGSVQAAPPMGVMNWGLDQQQSGDMPDGAIVTLDGTRSAGSYQDRYQGLVIARVENDAAAPGSDPVIDKSSVFAIPTESVEVPVKFGTQAMARLSQPRLIFVYVAIVPKAVNTDDITTLDSIAARGGAILSMVQTGGAGATNDDQLP